ncbi:MAG: GNAT family N-acetyltransferase [Fuscovulum sp.]|nr:GNAT family N-acetyltransferase [Fuscovulum sp.]
MRPAGPADAAALAALRADRALQHLLMANPDPAPPADPVAEAAAWIVRREGAGWFRVIDDGTGALGFVQISDIHRKNRFGWLGLALLPAARGRGLGARALAAAEAAARDELGLRKVLLQVRADNGAALALYDRASWHRVGTLRAQYDDGAALHDVVICEKALA